jgi:hypothetical protein
MKLKHCGLPHINLVCKNTHKTSKIVFKQGMMDIAVVMSIEILVTINVVIGGLVRGDVKLLYGLVILFVFLGHGFQMSFALLGKQ